MPKSKSASTEAPKKSRKAAAAPAKPSYEEIALRAYHIYLQRAGAHGDPTQDWLQAERELMASPKANGRKTKVVSIAA